MKAWLVAATLAMCVLFGVVSAQTYSIRVTYHTNLRASFSLESAFIETVPPGTTLQVVGNNNRWLRINRNGNDVWMADWVPYTRVDGSEATPEQATGNIDNCCFVDRQCQRDQDWIDGYWAFQNNQCVAPAQSQPGTSAPSASNASAQIDNCCYVDRQCHSDLDWINGYHAFENHQCGAPGQSAASASSQPGSGVILRTAGGIVYGHRNGRSILPSIGPSPTFPLGQIYSTNNCCQENWQCNSDQDWAAGYEAFQNRQCALPGLISIVGDPDFVDLHERSLDLLKNRLPHRYNYVLDGVDKVEQREGYVTAISVLSRHMFVRASRYRGHPDPVRLEEVAVTLVHEACHVHRFNAGYSREGQCDRDDYHRNINIREEGACVEQELQVLIEFGVEPDWIEAERKFLASIYAGEVDLYPCN